MSPAPARSAALEAVRRVRERNAYAHEVLASVLSRTRLTRADAALATRLAYGTLQCEGTLDETIARFADRPSRIEPRVRDVLRMSVYELLFARAPARAVVNEGVDAVRRERPEAAGLANAVLRRVAEAADDFPWGDPDSDTAALARVHAHPAWLAKMWVSELGRDAAADVMRADNEPAPLYVAHNPFRCGLDEAVATLVADGAEPLRCHLPGCIEATVPAAAVTGKAVASGAVIVADAASQLAPSVVGPHPGGRVVDAAAGRGTKTLLLQAQNQHDEPAAITALDVHAFKVGLLAERMDALGVPGVSAAVADATQLEDVAGLPGLGTADAVLVDAPCTGLGALRRHPEKRWRLDEGDVIRLAQVGARMLAEASRLVRVGGLVVYSTCTVAAAENDQVIDAFLSGGEGEGFVLRPVDRVVPQEWSRFVRGGRFQSLPQVGGPDGHFIAALERAD